MISSTQVLTKDLNYKQVKSILVLGITLRKTTFRKPALTH